MPRREVRQKDHFNEALTAIQPFKQSVLAEIATQLEKDLLNASAAYQIGQLLPEEFAGFASYVTTIARSLPSTFGRRFEFDAAQIQAMCDDWGDRSLFSSMIVPCYRNDWGHASLNMPGTMESAAGKRQVYMIDLILLPGKDRIDQIDLLSYPWLAHEMGHNLMFRHDGDFIPAVSARISAIVRKMRLATIADRGSARARSEKSIQELLEFWQPTADHRNWSHELGADLIALWVLGPAYLAVFQDLLEERNRNPYQISPVHPPYAIRVRALLNAAEHLGLDAHARTLPQLVASWRSSTWEVHRTNRFLRLANAELIGVLVQVTIGFCQKLGLARCTTERLTSLETALSNVSSQDFGTNLLLSAWLVFSRRGKSAYAQWEKQVVELLANSVMR